MVPTTWTINELLKVSTGYLKEKGVDSPRLTAEILLAHLLNTTRINLYLHFDQPLREEEVSGYRSLIRRRLNREPVQYITGTQEFWSLDFAVDPRVLIPRPESELLIEQALGLYGAGRIPDVACPRILDLCTGCGVLAVSLAKEIKKAFLGASDISSEALQVARKNAERHGVAHRILFVQGDLLKPFGERPPTFDLILSNPPYIDSGTYGSLGPEVRDHEPRQALDGGDQGMFFVREIIRQCPGALKSGGWILMEMDPEQTPEALSLLDKSHRFSEKKRVRDHSRRFRIVMARKG
ncbi:MAG: peptide chain release factor N(5)-glutamine methyltransferase [Pseudomonadota bacterium]